MSDVHFDDPTPDEDEKPVGIPAKDLRALREKARRAEVAERELAFAKAGIPLDDKRTPYFQAGYKGEVDPESIKAAWSDAFGAQEPPPAQAIPHTERQAHEQMAAAMQAGTPPTSTITADDISRAQSPEEVLRMASELGILSTRE